MKCYYHPDIDSINACSVCSRFLCPGCSHSVKGRFFCQDCLVQGADLAALARHPRVANQSPGRAALFGLIIGMGAVYNREYIKAVTHFAIFAALAIMAGEGPEIFGFGAFAFYIFTIIDAYRSAQVLIRKRINNPELLEEEPTEAVQLPVWGLLLVLLGVLFFLDNLGAVNLRDATRFSWPLFFIGAGLYLIFYYFTNSGASTPASGGSRRPPASRDSDRNVSVRPPSPTPPAPVSPPAEVAPPPVEVVDVTPEEKKNEEGEGA